MDYTSVSLPKSLAREIDGVIVDGRMGYRSRGEFVADAIRRRIDGLSTNPESQAEA